MRTITVLTIFLVAACSKPATEPTPTETPTLPVKAASDAPVATATPTEPDAAAAAVEIATPAPPDEPAAAKRPQNLQVLPKSWSLARVERYMEDDVVKGVGGKCQHCHKKNDFAADTKHKREARDMISLTMFLNKKYFESKNRITCFTCHKGKHEPVH